MTEHRLHLAFVWGIALETEPPERRVRGKVFLFEIPVYRSRLSLVRAVRGANGRDAIVNPLQAHSRLLVTRNQVLSVEKGGQG